MIKVENLTKKYGAVQALDNVSFTVEKGEIVGFLGPNGAGKSTTMNIITGYLSMTDGSVSINGYDILNDAQKAKQSIGYLPEHPPLYLDMTPYEYLCFLCDLKKVKLNRKKHIEEICELVKLTDMKNRLIKKLSKGYRQRVGIAGALIGNPEILILDEPTVGLDPNQIIEIRKLIKSLSKDHTIILSSHILSEIEAVCRRIIVINGGKLVADDTPQSLIDKYGDNNLLFADVTGVPDMIIQMLSSLHGVKSCVQVGADSLSTKFKLTLEEGADVREEIFKSLENSGNSLVGLYRSEPSLEDIFTLLTTGMGADESSVGKNAEMNNKKSRRKGKKEQSADVAIKTEEEGKQ